MKKIALTTVVLTVALFCPGQTPGTKYYNNQYLEKEVPDKKAMFSQTITLNPDGSVTTIKKDLKNSV
jgi:hypothetical protein